MSFIFFTFAILLLRYIIPQFYSNIKMFVNQTPYFIEGGVEKAKNILAAGFSMADVVMPLTKPWSIESMSHIKLD